MRLLRVPWGCSTNHSGTARSWNCSRSPCIRWREPTQELMAGHAEPLVQSFASFRLEIAVRFHQHVILLAIRPESLRRRRASGMVRCRTGSRLGPESMLCCVIRAAGTGSLCLERPGVSGCSELLSSRAFLNRVNEADSAQQVDTPSGFTYGSINMVRTCTAALLLGALVLSSGVGITRSPTS